MKADEICDLLDSLGFYKRSQKGEDVPEEFINFPLKAPRDELWPLVANSCNCIKWNDAWDLKASQSGQVLGWDSFSLVQQLFATSQINMTNFLINGFENFHMVLWSIMAKCSMQLHPSEWSSFNLAWIMRNSLQATDSVKSNAFKQSV